jgi:hypothetical protein
MAAID